MAKQTILLGAIANDGTGTPLQSGGDMINDNFTEIYDKVISGYFVVVKTLADLPTPVADVITLLPDTAYYFTTDIDLLGDSLLIQSGTVIAGTSSNTVSISSTGLGAPAMITSTTSVNIRDISFNHTGTIFSFNGTPATDNLYINNCAFFNGFSNVTDYASIIFDSCSFINTSALTIGSGTIGTLSFQNCLLSVATGQTGIIVDAAAIITRRFRSTFSAFIVPSTSFGINFNVSTSIPDESYILDSVNFTGAGTYLVGVDHTSNKSFFFACVGITNTSVSGQAYMINNATATTIAVANVYYKAAGTTTAGADNSRYLHSDNRLTCDATIERKYLVQCTLSFTTSASNVCKFGFYDSELGTIRTASQIKNTANSGGNAENVVIHDIVQHADGNYLEVHVMNTTAANNIVITDMNFMVTEIR